MLIIPPAQSSTERQRRFRERNPGYYARLQARRRAAAQPIDIAAMQTVAPPVQTPLLLPAPVQRTEIPGMTIIDQISDQAGSATSCLVIESRRA